MEEYLICSWSLTYGLFLLKARKFTQDEKKQYKEEFQENGFVGISKSIELEKLSHLDLQEIIKRPLNESDGFLCGCSNVVFIIDQMQWDKMLSLNNDRKREKEIKEKAEKIEYYMSIVAACEKTPKLYTDEEAKQARINYCNAVNEGGEGFMPHFYTFSEYENAKKQLEILEN